MSLSYSRSEGRVAQGWHRLGFRSDHETMWESTNTQKQAGYRDVSDRHQKAGEAGLLGLISQGGKQSGARTPLARAILDLHLYPSGQVR